MYQLLRTHAQAVTLDTATDDTKVIEETTFDVQNPPLAGLLYQSGYLTRRPKVTVTPYSCNKVLVLPNHEVQQAFQQSLRKWYETQAQEWFHRHAPNPYPFLNQMRMALTRSRSATAWKPTCVTCPTSCTGCRLPCASWLPTKPVINLCSTCSSWPWTPPQAEMPTVTGRLDWVVPLAQRIIVLELKVRQNATQALKQAFVQDCVTSFQTRRLPVTLFGLQFDATLLVIRDFRRWALGTFNVATARWQHEPFVRSLCTGPAAPVRTRSLCQGRASVPSPSSPPARPESALL